MIDIEDRIPAINPAEPDAPGRVRAAPLDPPAPPVPAPPRPAPAPARNPLPTWLLALALCLGLLVLADIGINVARWYRGAPPAPTPGPAGVDGVAIGRAYAPKLVATYATAWDQAAGALETGKTVGDAQKAFQETWAAERAKAFAADVEPGFSRVLAAGQEPADPAQRSAVTRLWRDFAKGLRGGR
jgi:type IV secretory pathway TrbL component